MPISIARVPTERPARYLKQLIAHLGHKATTTMTGTARGTVTTGAGSCALTATPLGLRLVATAADEESLARIQDVVARHLVRFAAQEELIVEWAAPVAGGDLEPVSPLVDEYLLNHCTPADEVLHDLATSTREGAPRSAGMQVAHDEGVLLTMLTKLVGARFAVEVGTFTGYSTLCIARGLAADGRVLTCDTSEEWTALAHPAWEQAGVADRIDLKLAPAIETLRALPADAVIDIAFIDADKEGYRAYYEEIVRRLRPGGLVVLDNVFLGGRVLDPAYQEADHVAMRELNDFIAGDERVESVMLPVRDGVTLARRR
ncbi:DUF2218 domain-containing protein [Kitasatospora sp. LaBMicrA B282]|uniref:DUF2218 domain-containing protein n=1 Tax=Kitasatospora sp. LaBMicrA B282 TaxID=3420949 RepID=UPI003D0CD02D